MLRKDHPHLTRAPIAEAVIDFKVTVDPKLRVESLETGHVRLLDDYPVKRVMHNLEVRSFFSPKTVEGGQEIKDEVIGYRFETSDGGRMVQFRIDGFTLNKLRPYTSWDEVFQEAWRCWIIYSEIAKPIDIARIAVRFINQTVLPERQPPVYLSNAPQLGQAVPGAPLTAFMFHAQLKIADNVNAAVLQMTEADAPTAGLPYVLDIDVSRTGYLANDRLPELFAELRNIKNDIFFNTVTHQALELWK